MKFMRLSTVALLTALGWCAPIWCDDKSPQWPEATPAEIIQTTPWEKIWQYTCLVQESAGRVLQVQKDNSTPALFFTTNPTTESRFPWSKWSSLNRLENNLSNNQLDIYFTTNSDDLDTWDRADLDKLAEYINLLQWEEVSVVLEWFADSRGTIEANAILGSRRTASVEDYLRSRIQRTWITFTKISHGETRVNESASNDLLSMRQDRRVSISINTDSIIRGLTINPADAYILDASDSMNSPTSDGSSRWSKIEGFNFPNNSSIFTFSEVNSGNTCAPDLDRQVVDLGTPLYISIIEVINTWNYENKIITVLTDWKNSESLWGNLDWVIQLAQQRWITINTIWIGQANRDVLIQISSATWWRFFHEE